jgi:hypothetical protein
MHPRQAAQIALGITGIWALIYALSGFAGIAAFVMFQGSAGLGTAMLQVAPSAVLLVLGYALVFHNAQAASVIFPVFGPASNDPLPDMSRLLVALTGVLIFGSSLAGLVGGLMSLLATAALPRGIARPSQIQTFTGRVVEAGFGLFLIMRPQWLLDYLRANEQMPSTEDADGDQASVTT